MFEPGSSIKLYLCLELVPQAFIDTPQQSLGNTTLIQHLAVGPHPSGELHEQRPEVAFRVLRRCHPQFCPRLVVTYDLTADIPHLGMHV